MAPFQKDVCEKSIGMRKMKIKTSGLKGAALDWAVASIELHDKELLVADCYDGSLMVYHYVDGEEVVVEYSKDWSQAGPIIEREGLTIAKYHPDCPDIKEGKEWFSSPHRDVTGDEIEGPTPLTAAMRCYVASKLGDEVEVPEELA